MIPTLQTERLIFAIAIKEDGGLAGVFSLIRIEEGHQAEIGYWIDKMID